MIGRLRLPAHGAPEIGVDGALDDKRLAVFEERLQLRRQQGDEVLGNGLVRFESPGHGGRRDN